MKQNNKRYRILVFSVLEFCTRGSLFEWLAILVLFCLFGLFSCHELESFGNQDPQLRKCAQQMVCVQTCIFLINNYCGKPQITTSGAISGTPEFYKKVG